MTAGRVTKCRRGVADQYALPRETIYEFSAPNGSGGLISFWMAPDGKGLTVQLYRLDPEVSVTVEDGHLHEDAEQVAARFLGGIGPLDPEGPQ